MTSDGRVTSLHSAVRGQTNIAAYFYQDSGDQRVRVHSITHQPPPGPACVLNETERILFVDPPGLSQAATDIMHSSELGALLSLAQAVTPGEPLVTTFVTSGD